MSTSAVDAEKLAEIKEIVCTTLELDTDEVTLTSLFQEEHGADSLGAIVVVAALERQYGIVIEQARIGEMVNLRAVYDLVAEAAGW